MTTTFSDLFKNSRNWGRASGPKEFFVVRRDGEFERIAALARREPEKVDLTHEFRKPGSTKVLWPLQSLALHEARMEAGLFGAIGVGHGKFLTSMLLPVAMQARVAVYLCPAQLKKQVLTTDYPFWRRHFYLPRLGAGLHVVSYEELSRAGTADILDRLQPDLIVADECFPPGTLVRTDVGNIPIESVQAGQMVWSWNGASPVLRPVVRTMRKPLHRSLVKVTHTQGFFVCTDNHKIWTDNRGYVEAEDLQEGDCLRCLRESGARETACQGYGQEEGRSSEISRVVRVEAEEQGGVGGPPRHCRVDHVYDLEVEETHNYFAEGVLVSNCHKLRYKDAARTKRFLRYMRASGANFAALSGTITTRSLLDYAHLIELALRRTSPLPFTHEYHTLREWAEALDSPKKGETPRGPGPLLELCSPEEAALPDPVEAARLGFRRRLVQTAGVVVSDEGSVGCSLIISARRPALPEAVESTLQRFRKTWKIGDEEIEEAPRFWAIARQLSMGFYYEWAWPNGEKDWEWLAARSFWHRELRHFLQHASRPGLDSPLFVSNALRRREHIGHPELYQAWEAWCLVKERPTPPTVVRWVDDFIVRDVAQYLQEQDQPTIVWYEHSAIGEALGKLPNLTHFPAGDVRLVQLADRLTREDRAPHILISAAAHGTGKNLQTGWANNLVVCPHPSGTVWEQAFLGRTHRQGQWADEVKVDVNIHTEELVRDFQQALRDAAYQEQTTSRHKLLYATKIGFEEALE